MQANLFNNNEIEHLQKVFQKNFFQRIQLLYPSSIIRASFKNFNVFIFEHILKVFIWTTLTNTCRVLDVKIRFAKKISFKYLALHLNWNKMPFLYQLWVMFLVLNEISKDMKIIYSYTLKEWFANILWNINIFMSIIEFFPYWRQYKFYNEK